VSLWCMGMNQHVRGTWINNLVNNLHLLTGKIGRPGNNPFSLTGQSSACGTVREVGTLAHRLPADMVVTNPEHRQRAAEIWGVPVEKIPAQPGYNTVEMFRALDRGDIRTMWIQCTNPMVTMPNLNRYRDAAKKQGRFIVVSDVYPTPTTDIADVILPSAMWVLWNVPDISGTAALGTIYMCGFVLVTMAARFVDQRQRKKSGWEFS